MKLIVKSKMTSVYKVVSNIIDEDSLDKWKTYEFEFQKVGLLKKPEFQVKNLSIQIVKQDNNCIICRTSDNLCMDLIEQRDVVNADSEIRWREIMKEKLDFMRSKGKYKDMRSRGCVFSEFPVTSNPIALVTLSDDVSYHYLFSIVV